MRGFLGIGFLLVLSLLPPALAQGAAEYFARCQRLYQQGALEGAQAACELSLASDPQYRPSLRLLARIRLEQGDLEGTQALLDRLGQDPEGEVLRAQLLLRQGRPAQVLGLPLPPGPEARLLQAQALEALGRYEEAWALAQSLPSTPEARLLQARLALALGHPEEGLLVLGPTLAEEVERGWLLLLVGRPQEAAHHTEKYLAALSQDPALQAQALTTLTLAYLGQGDLQRGLDALRQLSRVVNLPARLLAWGWPWLLALLAFLGLLLLGESRIEPLRTLEVVEDPLPGPGRLYLLLLGAWALALLLVLLLGRGLFGNALAFLTPYQQQTLLPNLYLAYGLFLFLGLLLWQRTRLSTLLGPWGSWVEGFGVGPTLAVTLLLYGWARGALGLSALPLHLLTFLGLALMEPFFRGLVPWVFRERYRNLAPYLSALLFALAVPGPTFLLFLLGAGLLWAKERGGSPLGMALGWVVAGVVLALLPAAWLRRFF